MDPPKAFCDSRFTYNSRVRYGPDESLLAKKTLISRVIFETSVAL